MKLNQNLKIKIYKTLFVKKRSLIQVENKNISPKKIQKDIKLIMNFLKKENSKIIEVSLDNKYLFFIILVSCLFTNKIVYPKKEPKITFNQSLSLFDEKKIKKILNSRNIPKIKFNFTNSNFLILETTGTTTVKKLMLAKANEYLMGCYHSKNIFKYNKLTKILHCLPIYYNAGLNNILFAPLLGESKVVFTKNFNSFKFKKIFHLAKKIKINSIQLMPNMYLNLIFGYRDKKFIKSLKSLISTGSYLYPEIQNKFYECFKKKIFSCYGITELGGALTIQNLLNCDVEGCVGEIKRNIKIKINKKKEILINTSFKMVGYLKDKKFNETNKFNNKKYFNSKDLGFVKKKMLHIIGRSKEIINRGGENISLKNIENVALKFKKIKNVSCFGVKNIFSGENIVMFIEVDSTNKIFKLNFLNHLKNSLDQNSIPNQIIYKKKFPYFSNGKMNRQLLKKSI